MKLNDALGLAISELEAHRRDRQDGKVLIKSLIEIKFEGFPPLSREGSYRIHTRHVIDNPKG